MIDRIAERTHAKRVLVEVTVQSFLDGIISELAKDNRLEFRDFGVFEPRGSAPRAARNPKTLERVCVPARQVVKFKAGRQMKQKLNGQNVETQMLVRK